MTKTWLAIGCMLIVTSASAQVTEHDRALGFAKLKKAYQLNGNHMDGGFFDTSKLLCYEVRGASGNTFFECMQPEELEQKAFPLPPDAKKVPLEKITPKEKK